MNQNNILSLFLPEDSVNSGKLSLFRKKLLVEHGLSDIKIPESTRIKYSFSQDQNVQNNCFCNKKQPSSCSHATGPVIGTPEDPGGGGERYICRHPTQGRWSCDSTACRTYARGDLANRGWGCTYRDGGPVPTPPAPFDPRRE